MAEQPELNYRNPEVLEAILGEMRFWLERGVDGFRVDVIWLMIKDEQLRDEPPDPNWDGVNPHFSRQLILTPWNAQIVRNAVDDYEKALPEDGWPNWVLSNHDQHRLATRVGPAQARVANMLLLTLRSTPTCYYGDEIGMQNVSIPPEYVQDPPAVKQPEIAHIVGRDPERTPMQWDATPNAGFADSGVQTWLPVSRDYAQLNVAAQSIEPNSMLSFLQALTRLRRSEAALSIGDYASVDAANDHIFAYLRSAVGKDSFLIVLNFGDSCIGQRDAGMRKRAFCIIAHWRRTEMAVF